LCLFTHRRRVARTDERRVLMPGKKPCPYCKKGFRVPFAEHVFACPKAPKK
jgi:hypothetical protein